MIIKEHEYYWTCPYCGANLDPGESCECKKEDKQDVDNYKLVQGGEKENGKSHKKKSIRMLG